MSKTLGYGQEVWEKQLDSKIVEVLESEDWSACYEMDAAHLVKLDNGKYVVIEERGCSCYDSSDATLLEFDYLEEARAQFNDNLKERTSDE